MATPPQEELDMLALEAQKKQENQGKKNEKSLKKNKEKVDKPKPGTGLVPSGVREVQGCRGVFIHGGNGLKMHETRKICFEIKYFMASTLPIRKLLSRVRWIGCEAAEGWPPLGSRGCPTAFDRVRTR